MDFCGALAGDPRFVVAVQLAAVRLTVTLVGDLGALTGAFQVVLRDGLPGGEFPRPAQQFFGTLGGFVSRRICQDKTVDRSVAKSWVDVGQRLRVG
jgi:hypothetical protein